MTVTRWPRPTQLFVDPAQITPLAEDVFAATRRLRVFGDVCGLDPLVLDLGRDPLHLEGRIETIDDAVVAFARSEAGVLWHHRAHTSWEDGDWSILEVAWSDAVPDAIAKAAMAWFSESTRTPRSARRRPEGLRAWRSGDFEFLAPESFYPGPSGPWVGWLGPELGRGHEPSLLVHPSRASTESLFRSLVDQLEGNGLEPSAAPLLALAPPRGFESLTVWQPPVTWGSERVALVAQVLRHEQDALLLVELTSDRWHDGTRWARRRCGAGRARASLRRVQQPR